MKIFQIIEKEIDSFISGSVTISEGYKFSQYKLIKRLSLYSNQVYPKGKIDKQGNYKYWTDIIQPRIDSEVKNIDFDTSNVLLYSEVEADAPYMIVCNLAMKERLDDTGQATEFNDSIEEGSGWGNVVWKKIKGGYERVDLKNFYIINQQAKTIDNTPVIEKHILTQSELRAKNEAWDNIEEVIKNCGNRGFAPTPSSTIEEKESPYYEIYERNGEISEQALKEAQGKTGGDENKFILAKIIVAGLKKGEKAGKYVLFAEELTGKMSDVYKEYHRGRYNGRWFRTGIYELLMDIQTRANEISNQIARGLEWSAKTLFRSQDKLIVNNILTDLNNGDVIKATDLQQIEVRMNGLDQLIADWNRLMDLANRLTNSYEVVTGESLPSGTPFRLGSMINQNANKLFDFLREKWAIALGSVLQDWVLSDILKNLKSKDVLRLTGDADKMNEYYMMVVNGWYMKNLLALPPHGPEERQLLLQKKLEEIKSKKEQFLKLEEGWLDGIKPRIKVVMTGENVNLAADLESLQTFIQLEADPVRRSYLVELAMKKKGISVTNMPRSTPQQLNGEQRMASSSPPALGQ